MKNLQKNPNTKKSAERDRTLMNPSIKINLGKVKRRKSKNTKHKTQNTNPAARQTTTNHRLKLFW